MSKKKRLDTPRDLDPKALLELIDDAGSTGITAQQLMLKLGLDKRERGTLQDALAKLMAKEKVDTVKRGRYALARPTASKRAKRDQPGKEAVLELIASGAGYARLSEGGDDVYIPAHAEGTALHGDTVLVRVQGHRGRPEGKVIKVLSRRRTNFVGTLLQRGPKWELKADDPKMNRPIVVATNDLGGGKAGEKVVVDMLHWEHPSDPIRGKVTKVLGKAGEHEVEMHAILAEFGLPAEFPEEVNKAAAQIPDGLSKAEAASRRDMRKVTTLTIDPADAKDLDDALSVRKLDNGHWEVGIHIADVSHYVQPGSIVDKEAAARATSVYLVDRTVPMLPERLSNNLCSLNPNEDKLSFSAIFELDEQARIKHEWFGRTVIRTAHRFSYQEAQAIIEGENGPYKSEVLTLNWLAGALRKDRIAKGALEIGGNEVKFILDSKGYPIGVYEKMMGPANWLIEEFMLLANKRVATWVSKRKGGALPFVYRIHDQPDPDKVEQLRTLAKSFGHHLKTDGRPEQLPHAINKLLREVKGKEEEGLLKQVIIRTMAKAVYSTDNIGHYGLAFEYYTHFTSPIRRYPDLMVHRAMAHYLAKGRPLNKEALEVSAVHSSQMEKRAADAERASVRYKQAEYMLARLGQTFDGIVSGLTNWGIYIELVENHCEGMIALQDLPGDHFRFDQEKYAVIGQRTGRRFRLGDEFQVTVRGVDMEKRTVDFSLAEQQGAPMANDPAKRAIWDERRPALSGTKGKAKVKGKKYGKQKRKR